MARGAALGWSLVSARPSFLAFVRLEAVRLGLRRLRGRGGLGPLPSAGKTVSTASGRVHWPGMLHASRRRPDSGPGSGGTSSPARCLGDLELDAPGDLVFVILDKIHVGEVRVLVFFGFLRRDPISLDREPEPATGRPRTSGSAREPLVSALRSRTWYAGAMSAGPQKVLRTTSTNDNQRQTTKGIFPAQDRFPRVWAGQRHPPDKSGVQADSPPPSRASA